MNEEHIRVLYIPSRIKINVKIVVFMIIIMMLFIISVTDVWAQSRDYVLDGTKRIPIPETYVLKKVIYNQENTGNGSGQFKEADDLFINSEGYLFVADTGNNRIVKMTREGMTVGIYKGPEDKTLNDPRGVYADDKGNMYIADTGNNRIVHLSSDGTFVEEFTKPQSELLDSDSVFTPTKVFISPTGYIYIIKSESVMIVDAYNRFRGYLGQTDIGFKFLDVFLRKFASEEQKRYIFKRRAAAYTNIVLDDKGMIYATTLDTTEGEIKKLNSIGVNIYRKYTTVINSLIAKIKTNLPNLRLTDKSFMYGERVDDAGNPIKPYFVDIAVDRNGIVTALEQTSGKIYQYDGEGNLLMVFGGMSDQKGMFRQPTSLVTDNDGNLYVLDKYLNNIQVFEPTRFIKLVHQAVKHYSDGEYNKSYDTWQEVLNIDENYQLAHTGMAKAFYKQKQWKKSMEEYVQSDDRTGYSMAFTKYRHDLIRNYFVLAVLALIIIVWVLLILIRLVRRMAEHALEEFRGSIPERMSIASVIMLSLAVLFHPIETFEVVKGNRGRLNYLPSVIILITVIAVRVFYIYTVHYPLADVDPKDANIWLEMVKLLLPVLTWVVASFATTAIVIGESKIDEIFVASSFCMVPYIVVNIPLALLSNILARNESGLYGFVTNISSVWILLLFFISFRTLNDYKIGKTAVISTMSAATMVVIWAIALLVLALTSQLYEFIAGIVREVRMTFL